MSEERRKEMGHYRELAKTVEARLQRLAAQNVLKRSSVDSGITLSSSEQQDALGNQSEKPSNSDRMDTTKKSMENLTENLVQDEEIEEGSNSKQSGCPFEGNEVYTVMQSEMEKVEHCSNEYTDILSENYVGYRPWEKNSGSNKDSKLQKNCHFEKKGKRATWNVPNQSTVSNEPKGIFHQKWVKNKENSCIIDKNYLFVNKTAGERDQELVSYSGTLGPEFLSCDNLRAQPVEQLPLAESELSSPYTLHQEKPSCESSFMDEGKFVKICEGVTDIPESLRLECSKLNESSQCNKANTSGFSSPDNSGLGSSNNSNCVLQVLGNQNIDDSVSSIVLTSSTDLNQYMNNTGSSGSFSPGHDVPCSHSCQWSGEPLQRSATLTFITKGSPVGPGSSSVSNFIREGSNVLQKSSSDVSEATLYNETQSCIDEFNKVYQIKDDMKCLTVPKVKLQTNKSPTVDNENPKSSNIPIYKYPHSPSHSRRKNMADNEKVQPSPPRLLRQNSYTLDSPSPVLIAHLETQKGKKSSSDMTETAIMSSELTKMPSNLSHKKGLNDSGSKNEVYSSPGSKTKMKKKSSFSPGTPLKHRPTSKIKERQNVSLPSSNASSPVKLQSPFISLDCLPSAVSKEPSKLVNKVSTPDKQRDTFKVRSSSARKETKCIKPVQRDTSIGNSRGKLSLDSTSEKIEDASKKESPNNAASQISQSNLHDMVLRLQSEHNQQMTVLLSKQKKEQEEMHRAFLQQQNDLMLEMYNICPAVLSKLESDSIITVQSSSSGLDGNTSMNSRSCPLSISRKSSDTCLDLNQKQGSERSGLEIDTFSSQDLPKDPINTSFLDPVEAKTGNNTSLEVMNFLNSPESNGRHITKKSSELYTDQDHMLVEKENSNNYRLVPSRPKSLGIESDISEDVDLPRREDVRVNSSSTEVGEHYLRTPCSRQLFSVRAVNQIELKKVAATKITAAVKGYLTRRLFRTARVQDIILTIRDTLLCAVQMNQDCWPDITSEDVSLHRRLIHQVTAACYALHEVFFGLTTAEKMAIIALDRERIRNQTARPPIPRPLSAATRRALERKILQSCEKQPLSSGPRPCRIRNGEFDKNSFSGGYEMGQSCLLRQQQQQTQFQQGMNKSRRSLNMNGARKPWR